MLRIPFVFLALLIVGGAVMAQPSDVIFQNFSVDAGGGFLAGVPTYLNNLSSKAIQKEDLLLHNEWEDCALLNLDGELLKGKARYNVMLDQIQLNADGQIRAVYSHMVQGVAIDEDLFIPAYFAPHEPRGDTLLGWGEQAVGGHFKLLERYFPYKRKTDYQVGTLKANNYEWVIRSRWYVLEEGASTAFLLKKGKRRILKLMADEAALVEKYAKDNRLSYRQMEDVFYLFQYYNSLKEVDEDGKS